MNFIKKIASGEYTWNGSEWIWNENGGNVVGVLDDINEGSGSGDYEYYEDEDDEEQEPDSINNDEDYINGKFFIVSYTNDYKDYLLSNGASESVVESIINSTIVSEIESITKNDTHIKIDNTGYDALEFEFGH